MSVQGVKKPSFQGRFRYIKLPLLQEPTTFDMDILQLQLQEAS